MSNLYIALLLLANAFMVLAIQKTMKIFFTNRRTPLPVAIISYIILWVALNLQTWWLDNAILITSLYLISLVFISLNYEAVMIKRIAAISGGYFVMISASSIFQFIVYMLIAVSHAEVVNIAYISAMLLIYLLVLLASKGFKNIKNTTINLDKLWLPFIFFPSSQAISVLLFHLNLPFVTQIWGVVSSLGVAFIIFYLYNNLSKSFAENVQSALHSQEKEYYFTQCQLMQESAENIKSIRHDMKSHLTATVDFIEDGRADEAANYLKGLLGDIAKNETYSNTRNVAFDSIINFKLNNAKNENIKLDIRLLIPPALNIEVADIVIIIGNLLDNALDAVATVEEKIIKLDIEYSRESLYIQIENTFDGVVQYAEEISEEEKTIVTRKAGNGHGHGLKNIKKSVEKYNGHIDICHGENNFSVGILLYAEELTV